MLVTLVSFSRFAVGHSSCVCVVPDRRHKGRASIFYCLISPFCFSDSSDFACCFSYFFMFFFPLPFQQDNSEQFWKQQLAVRLSGFALTPKPRY